MATGGLYLDPAARTFLQALFACPILPVYGIMECTSINFFVKTSDPTLGHVGGPGPNTEFKLVDIPELGFFHTDKDNSGLPQPRGELYLRGPGIFIGYFREPEKTQASKDKNGWMHTGDLAEILSGSQALRILGRRQNSFKLATGELVIPEQVEEGLFKSKLFDEVIVCGNSKHKFTVAVIVPKKAVVLEIAESKHFAGSYEQLCNNLDIRREFVNRLHAFS